MKFEEHGFIQKHQPLFHITRRLPWSEDDLWRVRESEEEWGSGGHDGSKYGEPSTPRICFSPSMTQCFYAIYPMNWCKKLVADHKSGKMKTIDFDIYIPIVTGSTIIVPNEEIVKKRWVWDAHITGESWIVNDVKMEKIGIVKFNPKHGEYRQTRPYNNSKGHLLEVGPMWMDLVVIGPCRW